MLSNPPLQGPDENATVVPAEPCELLSNLWPLILDLVTSISLR